MTPAGGLGFNRSFGVDTMAMTKRYEEIQPTRAEIDSLRGAVVVEFGTAWCGFCRAAQPLIEAALAAHPEVHHIKVEDGKGRPLGRSFAVKLWPTLVFMRDGQEMARVVRPPDVKSISDALERIVAA